MKMFKDVFKIPLKKDMMRVNNENFHVWVNYYIKLEHPKRV